VNRTPSLARRASAALAVLLLAPVGFVAALVAVLFLVDQVISGWIPSRWFSSSAADWVFGAGTAGSARSYLGFMAAGLVAAACLKGVERAVGVLRRRETR